MNNRYSLGVDLTSEQEVLYWDMITEDIGLGSRRSKEYWNVFDQNMGMEHARKRFIESYPELSESSDPLSMFKRERAFVTENTDLASELIRVLGLDFVHDFKTGIFFFDVFGRHELFMGYIYEEINNAFLNSFEEASEMYIQKGYGCFKSSQSRKIMIGEDIVIPGYLSQFKSLFERI